MLLLNIEIISDLALGHITPPFSAFLFILPRPAAHAWRLNR